jgi:hypothetical protein
MQGIELFVYCGAAVCSLVGQGCGWYWFFNACGCMEYEQEQVRTQPPPPPPPTAPNPFVVNGMPKDPHLQPAYR